MISVMSNGWRIVMSMARILSLALAVSFTAVATHAVEESKSETKAENQLVGTWKLVSAKYGGEEFMFPEGLTMLKHVTPTQFMWATYDKDGNVTRAAGGTYTLKAKEYEETPAYGLGEDFEAIKGKKQSFTWTVEKNKWHHSGKLSTGLTIEEVWERVEKK